MSQKVLGDGYWARLPNVVSSPPTPPTCTCSHPPCSISFPSRRIALAKKKMLDTKLFSELEIGNFENSKLFVCLVMLKKTGPNIFRKMLPGTHKSLFTEIRGLLPDPSHACRNELQKKTAGNHCYTHGIHVAYHFDITDVNAIALQLLIPFFGSASGFRRNTNFTMLHELPSEVFFLASFLPDLDAPLCLGGFGRVGDR